MKDPNKQLYESIVYNLSKEVKRALNEEIQYFDAIDYEDNEDEVADIKTINQFAYSYHPKNTQELIGLIDQRIEENPKEPYLLDIDTSKITNMAGLFSYQSKIEKLDLSTWQTGNVTDMGSMFNECNNLVELDISSFDTSKVTNMRMMFYLCTKLVRLNVSGFDTSNVIYMNDMFGACKSLKELDVSNFNTSNVINMACMFAGCHLIKKLDLHNFDTSGVINMYGLFQYCISLTDLDISNFDTSNATDIHGMFSNCEQLTNIDVSHFNTSKVEDLTCMFSKCLSLTELDLSNFNTSNVESIHMMFKECKSLTELDLSNFNISKVTYMNEIFKDCELLEILNLSGWDTSRVIQMNIKGVFDGCTSLETLYTTDKKLIEQFNNTKRLSESIQNFDISGYTDDEDNIIDQQTIYDTAYKYHPKDRDELIRLIDQRIEENPIKPYLLDIDTSKIINMAEVFAGSESVEVLDLSTWNTSNVVSMSWMFGNCRSLKKLNLSSFDTSNVMYMNCMFQGCEQLTNIDLSGFNTFKVINMYSMFGKCTALKQLDLSNFNISSLQHMKSMFNYCTSLEELDLTNWDTSNIDIIYMSNIFSKCESLKTLYTSDKKLIKKFNTRKKVTESIYNFNIEDYQEDDTDIIDQDTISYIAKPKNIDEENYFFKITKPSNESLNYAQEFTETIKSILGPLKDIKISKQCLWFNRNSFYLYGTFSIRSIFGYFQEAYEYAIIDYNYDILNDKFTLNIDTEELAKMIEYCNLYGNKLTFRFSGQNQYYYKFQHTFHADDTILDGELIYPVYNNSKTKVNPEIQIEKIFKWIYKMYKAFASFIPEYITRGYYQ